MPSGASLVHDSLPGRGEKKNYRVGSLPCRYRLSNREFSPVSVVFRVLRVERVEGKCILVDGRAWVQRRVDDSISLETVFYFSPLNA